MIPLGTIAIKQLREYILTLHHSITQLHLVNGLIPREVLTHSKANTCKRVTEVEFRCRMLKLRHILNIARTSRHQVDLLCNITVYLEINTWTTSRSISIINGHLVIALCIRIDSKEASLRLCKRPLNRRIKFAIALGPLSMKPLWCGENTRDGCTTYTRGREVAKGRGFDDVGTCVGIRLNRIDTLDSGLYQADINIAIAMGCELTTSEIVATQAGSNSTTCHDTTTNSPFLHIVYIKADKDIFAIRSAIIQIGVGTRHYRQSCATS